MHQGAGEAMAASFHLPGNGDDGKDRRLFFIELFSYHDAWRMTSEQCPVREMKIRKGFTSPTHRGSSAGLPACLLEWK